MDGNYFIGLLVFLPIILMVIYEQRQTMQQIRMRQIKKRRKGANPMSEALQRYVGKKCVVFISNGSGVAGIVKSVEESWLAIDAGKPGKEKINMINTDYIMRIEEK